MQLQGWIIYNGYLKGTKFLDYANMIAAAARKQGHQATLIKNNELLNFLSASALTLLKEESNALPDYVVFTDKDIYLAKQLELLGVPVFNRARAIEISDDKIATYQQLASQKIPIPDTIIAPKVFPNSLDIDTRTIDLAIDHLGFPMIVKEAFGSFGKQVYLVNNREALLKKVHQLRDIPFVFQKFVTTSYGKDIRLQVVGDEVVASMKRQAKNDFRANVTAGGTMEQYEPSDLEKELAIKATKAIGADFAGVDLLFGPNKPLVCEVNSNAHIRNIYNCTNTNVADDMIKYIKQKLNF